VARWLAGREDGTAGLPEGGMRNPASSIAKGWNGTPGEGRHYRSLTDLRDRTGLSHDDLRTLIKVGALDSIAEGKTRPMMLWEVDEAARRTETDDQLLPSLPSTPLPQLREYTAERRRREEYETLSFTTATHPMALHAESLRRFRLVRSTELEQHVGENVLMAGMLTTVKPVHTAREEPMEFATFDDGPGLIETVLFPDVYRERGHVLFDQGPFIFRGKVEMEFGAVTLTITHLDRLERMLNKVRHGGTR
jgi:DNA polymerase III alpha subunit